MFNFDTISFIGWVEQFNLNDVDTIISTLKNVNLLMVFADTLDKLEHSMVNMEGKPSKRILGLLF